MEEKIKQIDASINDLLIIIERLLLKKEKLLKQHDEAPSLIPIIESPSNVENNAQSSIAEEIPQHKSEENTTCSTNKINNEKEEKSLLDMFEDDDGIFDRRRQAHLKYYGK
jgi:uncharacterized protein (DUF2147 family)